MVHQFCNICVKLGSCFSELIECLSSFYDKAQAGESRIPRNSCLCVLLLLMLAGITLLVEYKMALFCVYHSFTSFIEISSLSYVKYKMSGYTFYICCILYISSYYI